MRRLYKFYAIGQRAECHSLSATAEPHRAILLPRQKPDPGAFQRLPHQGRRESTVRYPTGLEIPYRDDADPGRTRQIGRRPIQERSRFAALCGTHLGKHWCISAVKFQ
jgi:hypothetical protein